MRGTPQLLALRLSRHREVDDGGVLDALGRVEPFEGDQVAGGVAVEDHARSAAANSPDV